MLTLQELEVRMASSMVLNAFLTSPAPRAVKRTFSRCHSDTNIVDKHYKVLASLSGVRYQQDAVLRVIDNIGGNRARLQRIGCARHGNVYPWVDNLCGAWLALHLFSVPESWSDGDRAREIRTSLVELRPITASAGALLIDWERFSA